MDILTIIGKAFFWIALAFAFAAMEIESEAKYGWAEKMPTWYRVSGLAGRLHNLLMAKPLTGYHVFMNLFMVLAFHIPMIMGVERPVETELLLLAYLCIFWVLEDFLWFVLNPHYTFKGFKKHRVWWHAGGHWFFNDKVPAGHVYGTIAFVLLSLVAGFNSGMSVFVSQMVTLATMVMFVLISILAAPLYHRWYREVRRYDDRDQANIRH